jgi:hypothetical protein
LSLSTCHRGLQGNSVHLFYRPPPLQKEVSKHIIRQIGLELDGVSPFKRADTLEDPILVKHVQVKIAGLVSG